MGKSGPDFERRAHERVVSVDAPVCRHGLSCPFSHLCFTDDDVGELFAATHPSLGAWRLELMDAYVTSVSCPTPSFCVAVGAYGGVRVASRAPRN